MSGLIDWQLAMVSLFGNLTDVKVMISGDGTTNIYEAIHLKSGVSAVVSWPRSDIRTPADQEVHMIEAMDKLYVMCHE